MEMIKIPFSSVSHKIAKEYYQIELKINEKTDPYGNGRIEPWLDSGYYHRMSQWIADTNHGCIGIIWPDNEDPIRTIQLAFESLVMFKLKWS